MNIYQAKLLFSVIAALVLSQCALNGPRFNPSDSSVYVPSTTTDYHSYIKKNKEHIRESLGRRFVADQLPFGVDFPLDRMLNHISSPFEITQKCDDNEMPVGVLVLHGLFANPGSMMTLAESIHKQIPCSLIRGTLMAGHGTVPADALETHYEEWQKMTAYAVSSFQGKVSDLFIVGFSTGGPLAVDYVQNPKRYPVFSDAPQVSGLILLSPALFLSEFDALAFLKPIFPYIITGHDVNPYRYESIPMNLVLQIYNLSKVPDYDKDMNIPVSIAMSTDDSAVDFKRVNQYFCQKFSTQSRKMLVYPGLDEDKITPCHGVEVHEPLEWPNEWHMQNFSHEALYHPPEHPFSGYDAKIHKSCDIYGWNKHEKEQCETNLDHVVYGEINLMFHPRIKKEHWLRLSTFNPFYEGMVSNFVGFINKYRLPSADDSGIPGVRSPRD